jgi:hypothetical protein
MVLSPPPTLLLKLYTSFHLFPFLSFKHCHFSILTSHSFANCLSHPLHSMFWTCLFFWYDFYPLLVVFKGCNNIWTQQNQFLDDSLQILCEWMIVEIVSTFLVVACNLDWINHSDNQHILFSCWRNNQHTYRPALSLIKKIGMNL